MLLIRLHDDDGKDILINPDHIVSVAPRAYWRGAILHMTGTMGVFSPLHRVKETVQEVEELLEKALRMK